MPLNTNKYIRIINQSADKSDDYEVVSITPKKHLSVRVRHIASSVEFNAIFPKSPSNTGAAEKCVLKVFKLAHKNFIHSPHCAAAV